MCNRTGTIRGRSRHRLAIAAILALALTVPRAEAGTVTATLEAFPPSIDEGGTTNLKLTLVHAPTDRDILYDSTSKRRYYYAGSGSIDSLASATVYSGDGQTFSGLGGLFSPHDLGLSGWRRLDRLPTPAEKRHREARRLERRLAARNLPRRFAEAGALNRNCLCVPDVHPTTYT
jgi:hypothetical protein